MVRTLLDAALDRMESRWRVDMDHMRTVARHAPLRAVRLGAVTPMLGGPSQASSTLHHLARLGAVRAMDCGPCVQIEIAVADEAGVPTETLAAALDRDAAALSEEEALAVDYGRAVASDPLEAAELADRVRDRLGEAVLVDLAVAAGSSLLFPALKRGLGLSRSCETVELRLPSAPQP